MTIYATAFLSTLTHDLASIVQERTVARKFPAKQAAFESNVEVWVSLITVGLMVLMLKRAASRASRALRASLAFVLLVFRIAIVLALSRSGLRSLKWFIIIATVLENIMEVYMWSLVDEESNKDIITRANTFMSIAAVIAILVASGRHSIPVLIITTMMQMYAFIYIDDDVDRSDRTDRTDDVRSDNDRSDVVRTDRTDAVRSDTEHFNHNPYSAILSIGRFMLTHIPDGIYSAFPAYLRSLNFNDRDMLHYEFASHLSSILSTFVDVPPSLSALCAAATVWFDSKGHVFKGSFMYGLGAHTTYHTFSDLTSRDLTAQGTAAQETTAQGTTAPNRSDRKMILVLRASILLWICNAIGSRIVAKKGWRKCTRLVIMMYVILFASYVYVA